MFQRLLIEVIAPFSQHRKIGSAFQLLSAGKRKKKEEEEINIYSYERRGEKQTEKKRRNITILATYLLCLLERMSLQ